MDPYGLLILLGLLSAQTALVVFVVRLLFGDPSPRSA